MATRRRGFVRRMCAAVWRLVSWLWPGNKNGDTYRNWSRTVYFKRERYCEPTTEGAVIKIVEEARKAKKHVRTVGTGHSFSQLVVTPNTLVSLDKLKTAPTFDGADEPLDEPRPTHADVMYGGGSRVSQR